MDFALEDINEKEYGYTPIWPGPKTHPDFQSLFPKFSNAEILYDYLCGVLCHQNKHCRSTPPREMHRWNNDDSELQKFKIDLEQVDRLYYLDDSETGIGDGKYYIMICRMQYEGESLYIAFYAKAQFFCYKCENNKRHTNSILEYECKKKKNFML